MSVPEEAAGRTEPFGQYREQRRDVGMRLRACFAVVVSGRLERVLDVRRCRRHRRLRLTRRRMRRRQSWRSSGRMDWWTYVA